MGAQVPDVRSKADVYFPVIARAVSQLSSNTKEARQEVYDRTRTAHAAHLAGQGASKSESDILLERLALETAIGWVEEGQEAAPGQAPLAISDVPDGEQAVEPKWLKVRLSSPLHRATTAFLIVSIFFFNKLWLIDITCMSLYWVARLPRPRGFRVSRQ
jgi:hypothetical protein